MDRTVPAGAALLLDFIGDTEAPNGYDTIFGNRQTKLYSPITSMTLAELQANQKNWASKVWVRAHWGAKTASSASGRYQFMRDTMKGLIAELKLSTGQKFDANLQDRLGLHLLKRRGYDAFAAGKIDITEFGKRLAQEWASFPVLTDCQGAHRWVKRGETYYAGDALNKSLVKPEKVETILKRVRELARMTIIDGPDTPAPKPAPTAEAPAQGFWAWVAAGLLKFIRGGK
jgi:muramidase (phage lysozyme)